MRRLVRSVALLLSLAALPAFTAASVQAAKVNDKAPAFELVDLSGAKASFDGTEGVTVINFWATWCAPCAVEFPKLNELAAAYKGKVRVLAISVDEDNAKTKVTAFLKKRVPGGASLDVLLDQELKSAEAYGVDAMPTTFVVDSKGVIRFKHTGFKPNDPEEWRKELNSLLK